MKSEHHLQSTTLLGRFAVLRADALRLLLPLDEIDPPIQVTADTLQGNHAGIFRIAIGGEEHWVVAPSERLHPLRKFPQDRTLLTRMRTERRPLYFAWNEVQMLVGAELKKYQLPPAAEDFGSPIDGYVLIDGPVQCTNAHRLVLHTLSNRLVI